MNSGCGEDMYLNFIYFTMIKKQIKKQLVATYINLRSLAQMMAQALHVCRRKLEYPAEKTHVIKQVMTQTSHILHWGSNLGHTG